MNISNYGNISAILILLIIYVMLFISAEALAVEAFESIHLLKSSPQDERAVVKLEDGSMKIIRPGEAIGKSGKAVEITSDLHCNPNPISPFVSPINTLDRDNGTRVTQLTG